MKTACVDLKKSYPDFKIALDPSAEDPKDPWMFTIPGRLGTIYPHGSCYLCVDVDGHPAAVAKLKAINIPIYTEGWGEVTFRFHQSCFREVAKIVGSYKKRVLSADTKAKLARNAAAARQAKIAKTLKPV